MRKRKNNKNQNNHVFEIYKNYCDFHLKYCVDPIGLFVTVYLTDILEKPVLSSLLYICIILVVRIPLYIHIHEKELATRARVKKK